MPDHVNASLPVLLLQNLSRRKMKRPTRAKRQRSALRLAGMQNTLALRRAPKLTTCRT